MTSFFIKNRSLPAEGFAELKKILRSEIEKHGGRISGRREGSLILSVGIDHRLAEDSFRIAPEGNRSYSVSATSLINCFAATGHFLRSGSFDREGNFTPPSSEISHRMKKPVRGIYLATHFYNYHHSSPAAEEERYIAEQALRGFNSVMFCLAPQHYTSFTEPAALEMIERLKMQIRFSKKLGMSTAFVGFSNTGFSNYSKKYAAQIEPDGSGRYARPITAEFITEVCPSTDGGMKEIERLEREFLSAFAGCDIDYLYIWPYDEGGCLCEKCYPWSTNGFMKTAELLKRLMKEYGMKTKPCISTWHFGAQLDGEWDIFYKHLSTGEYDWAEYIMTCFQSGRVPGVIMKNGVPDGVKFVDFPEISMQNPASPWGGRGATPFPMYLDACEKNCGHLMQGGYLYSEGIYEDVNKFIVAGYYSGLYKSAPEALRAYAAYEFGIDDPVILCEFVNMCNLMEASHKYTATFREDAPSTFVPRYATPMYAEYDSMKIIDQVIPASLKNGWKWRIFVIRASIDRILLKTWSETGLFTLKDSPEAQKLLSELDSIYYVSEKTKSCVLPPLGV